ncbi:MAG: serine/threonine-protein kinase [Microbacterium sp.]
MTDLRLSGPAQPGEVLDGRYRLEELIGEGGMGSVWRASDQALGRTVAVKVFWTGTTEETDAVRRESEKRLLASVSHPSLVTLFDAQLSQGERSYLVMEYIDGGTLAGLIARGPVSSPDAASLAADLGEALHVVHSAGIIHRDVKPANILLRPPLTPDHTFRAILADFGIAYLVDAARVTTPGTAIGTAAYISPEQVRGHAPTTASDIYSLGLVLLEALSGRRAFVQQTPIEAISARLTTPPDVPGDWGYGWRSLLTAMTSVDPQNRPTALEVSMQGRALDSGDPDPDATVLVPELPATVGVGEVRGLDATEVLVPPTTAATALIPEAGRTPKQKDAESATPKGRRRRLSMIAAGAVAVIVAAVLALTVWNGIAAAPPPPPDLPQLDEPLGTDLQNLLDEVSP